MAEILLGFMVAAWLFTVIAGVYVSWRYVKVPWQVMRKDIIALNELIQANNSRIDAIENDMGLRRVGALTNEQIARIERNNKMRKLVGELEG